MPSRRAYLGSLSAFVVGAAGCTARQDQADGTTSPSENPTATTPDRPDITVQDAAVQYSYRHVYQVDWNDVAVANGQFVFVGIDAPDDTVPYLADEFRLLADGERYVPKRFDRHPPAETAVGSQRYAPSAEYGPTREGWLCFQTPSQLEEQPTLLLETNEGTWEWPVEAPRATKSAPEWEWTADAPDTVAPGEDFSLEVAAENVGDGPGVFRGAVNFSYPMYRPKGFDIPLGAGESGRTTVSASAEHAEGGQEIPYRFVTAAGETKLTVKVEGGTGTETENGTETGTATESD